MTRVLCVDFGSTYTKAALVDTEAGSLVATASTPTTADTDVLAGYDTLLRTLAGLGEPDAVMACSSAGGGLRVAVVGYEREASAEAGYRVGLSAGGKVVHVAAGPLTAAGVGSLRAVRPDIVLLVGGTDGGNAEVLLHNATRLARARIRVPVVVAGNAEATPQVASILAATGRRVTTADNVLPRIGTIAPQSARAAIREAFLAHVIGGKGLSRDPAFAAMVRAATPDAVLRGMGVVAILDGDVLAVDIGGATTDVYSAITPQGEDAVIERDVVAPLWQSRTVEADLGVRWNAEGIVEAAAREQLTLPESTIRYAVQVAASPGHLPISRAEWDSERDLARAAAVVAVRRHARAASAAEGPRPLQHVRHVIGSGGVLRHAAEERRRDVLDAVTMDYAGGWRVPEGADGSVDAAYLLFVVGLLADSYPEAARVLAGRLLGVAEVGAGGRLLPAGSGGR